MEDPLLRSGLVLAGANNLLEVQDRITGVDDGWLTANEITAMDLDGTELVVLSACETGLGDLEIGQGVRGLRQAFLYAGAKTLLISLFKVPDTATQQLMHRFYEALSQGKNKLASIREARLETIRARRAESGAAHPFFWASWVFVGAPG